MAPPEQVKHVAAPAIGLHNLTLGYERHPAVHHVTAHLPPGSLMAVLGPNGAGKTTLIKALAGLLQPLQGHISGLAGQRVAYLPQRNEIDHTFPITVDDMVAMGLWHEVGAFGGYSPAQRQRCANALSRVGLNGFGKRTLATLSGGQLQRALFARLMLQDAPVVLLDEPFAGVDTRTTRDLLALMAHWQREGRTVLAVLHDLEQARQHFPHAMLLARELVAFGDTAHVLTPSHLSRARRLNEAFDDDAPDCHANLPSTASAHTANTAHPHRTPAAQARPHPETHLTSPRPGAQAHGR